MKQEDLKRVIEIKKNKETLLINIDDIVLCVADGNNSDIYTTKAIYRTIRISKGEILDIIKNDKLHHLREVGKYYIMNLDAIDSISASKRTVKLKNYFGKIVMPDTLTKSTKRILDDGGIVISGDAMKALLLQMDDNERRKVLVPLIQPKLTIHYDELNAEHLMASGNEYVDMALPSGTKWSIKNIGTSPRFRGGYYQWNTYFPSKSYDKGSYLPEKTDCVNILWGDNWRMPTLADFKELEENCILTWCISKTGDYGCLVTAKNGNRIFIPAYGMKKGTEQQPQRKNSQGLYWTSDIAEDRKTASVFTFNQDMDDHGNTNDEVLCYNLHLECPLGLSIRPVINKVENETEAKKRILAINNYDQIVELGFKGENDTLNCMSYEPRLSADPEKAMAQIKELCEKIKPDLILGYGTGCFFVHQLNGYDRLLVNPEWFPSTIIPQDESAEELGYTQDVIDKFAKMESCQFEHIHKDKLCWMAFSEPDDSVDEFCKHYDPDYAFELFDDEEEYMGISRLVMSMWGK